MLVKDPQEHSKWLEWGDGYGRNYLFIKTLPMQGIISKLESLACPTLKWKAVFSSYVNNDFEGC